MDKKLILREIKKHLGYTKDGDFADFLGIKQNTLSNWKSRNTIDYDLIISKCENIDANWLLTGKGEMLKQPQGYTNTEKPPQQVAEPQAVYQSSDTSHLQGQISFLKREIEYLQDKISLLQENKRLLEDKIKTLEEKESNYIQELKNTISRLEQENHT
ncbi:helix-turn-helix domain-containing protein [Riemerella anatipestifer]|uniref:helix-turn-helix domain-containing protein n=1 Tax=Riemerella anatipestifer TaxID=34085 RepID=UPI001BDA2ED8|nr:helix-turn-helix domain-containing protein [Riemerella anatipestifer]MBT0551696.1 helix-turn-helix domain-containing protein [Riemerella anatipestifer]